MNGLESRQSDTELWLILTMFQLSKNVVLFSVNLLEACFSLHVRRMGARPKNVQPNLFLLMIIILKYKYYSQCGFVTTLDRGPVVSVIIPHRRLSVQNSSNWTNLKRMLLKKLTANIVFSAKRCLLLIWKARQIKIHHNQ